MASFLPDQFTSPSSSGSSNMKRSLSESSTDNETNSVASSNSTLPPQGEHNQHKRRRQESFKSDGSYPATSFRRESQASSTLSQQSSEEDLDDEGEAEAGHSHPVAARGNASTTSQSDTDFSESSDTERRKSTEQNLYSPPGLHQKKGGGGNGPSSAARSMFSPPHAAAASAMAPSSSAFESARPDEPGQYSSPAMRMMSAMGYKEGKGLGKVGQGRVEPVQMSNQRGRRGLGMIVQGLEEGRVDWDASKEHIVIEEVVNWLPECTRAVPEMSEMRKWPVEGPRKECIDDETQFVDKDILTNVLRCKTIFDHLEPEELRKARSKSNPFETIRGGFFLNRAAMKMANMDAVFDFMFSSPKQRNDELMVKDNQLLYFADVCAGPGGFSEYVLWRKKWRSKGFGFTLKGSHDFKLEDFFAGPPESFETHYGVNGRDGDGNVFNEDNLREFKKFVLRNTDDLGVHFMMADGGFSVEGQENIQEILSKQLYLCQFLVAMSIVRPGGNFVCKVFDLFTPFSVGLVYLLWRSFEKVAIHKPNTSRPANSERYVICKWKRPDSGPIGDYMFELNARLNQLGLQVNGSSNSENCINEIVPMSMILEDKEFMDYITESNNTLGEWQIAGLAKIAAFCRDRSLHELRQSEIRDQCLHFWKVPDQIRKAPKFEPPQVKANSLFRSDSNPEYLASEATELSLDNLKDVIRSKYDWKFVLLGSASRSMISESADQRTFFLGLGRSKVYQLRTNARHNPWQKIDESKIKLELPAGTLIYAEIVTEMRGECKSMRRATAIHIIDALFIGGEDIRGRDFMTRNQYIQMLAKAVNKPTRSDYVVLRPKEIHSLERLDELIEALEPRLIKGDGNRYRLTSNIADANEGQARYYIPNGILLYRICKQPYMIALSKSQNRKYWFHTILKKATFECPKDASLEFKDAFTKRLHWAWGEGVKIRPGHEADPINGKKLQAKEVKEYLESI